MYIKSLILIIAVYFSAQNMFAQEVEYKTDNLKKLPKISDNQWKDLKNKSAARSTQFLNTNKGDVRAFAQKGYTVIGRNQSLNLTKEVNAVFDYVLSTSQDKSGKVSSKNRYAFKIGPGNYEVKDYVITRIEKSAGGQ